MVWLDFEIIGGNRHFTAAGYRLDNRRAHGHRRDSISARANRALAFKRRLHKISQRVICCGIGNPHTIFEFTLRGKLGGIGDEGNAFVVMELLAVGVDLQPCVGASDSLNIQPAVHASLIAALDP